MYSSKILGFGSYLPSRVLTNQDLEKMVDTSDAWILERTGIAKRHLADPSEASTDLALKASQAALSRAGLQPTDIDAIFFATTTPDQIMPASGCILQSKLGCRPIFAFDLAAACSGFLYCLSIADQFVRSGVYRNILVVGAETLSRIIDYKDRGTCILFGDGAGAFVVGRAEGKERIYDPHMETNGSLGDLLILPAGGSKMPFSQEALDKNMHLVHMKGKEIFKSAVRAMATCAQETLKKNKLAASEIDWFIPHQANVRIIEAVASQLDFPMSKVIMNIRDTGNTSSASIPIAFDQAVADGRIKRGQKVLLAAFGGGLTSGAVAFQF